MGQNLAPIGEPLGQAEVLRRIVDTFGEVQISRHDGAASVRKRREHLTRLKAPTEVLLANASDECERQAVNVLLWKPGQDKDGIGFTLFDPVDRILILFSDGRHEAAMSDTVERLAHALGYESHLV